MSGSGEGPSPNWLELPRDITASILLRLGAIEILNNAQRVCSQWRGICKEPSMWTTIDMRNGGDFWDMSEGLEVICRHAVDRSCGGLVDINIEHFGTDELLEYITARCTRVKCLRLVYCYNISDTGLSKAAAKLSLLEDLELSYCLFTDRTLAAVGLHCPLLKSLKLNDRGYRYPYVDDDDDEAQAIAKTMPELRRLQLFGNKLSNVGLKAILDGCPHLESLDLRQCLNLNLSGKLGKRCAEQVKDLKLPFDPTHDYEFSAELQEDAASFDEDYPGGFSDIDMVSEDDDHYSFSGDEEMDWGSGAGAYSDPDI